MGLNQRVVDQAAVMGAKNRLKIHAETSATCRHCCVVGNTRANVYIMAYNLSIVLWGGCYDFCYIVLYSMYY